MGFPPDHVKAAMKVRNHCDVRKFRFPMVKIKEERKGHSDTLDMFLPV